MGTQDARRRRYGRVAWAWALPGIPGGTAPKETSMKVREAMTGDVCLTNPDRTIREAAQMMADQDVGALPVGENDRLVGMITDRDIAVRAVCKGLGPDTKIREVMSQEV